MEINPNYILGHGSLSPRWGLTTRDLLYILSTRNQLVSQMRMFTLVTYKGILDVHPLPHSLVFSRYIYLLPGKYDEGLLHEFCGEYCLIPSTGVSFTFGLHILSLYCSYSML